MRCKNCGWPNKPNETTCVKCHAALGGDDDPVVAVPVADAAGGTSGSLKNTVLEDDVFGRISPVAHRWGNTRQADANPVCQKCGYPMRDGAAKCPNCGTLQGGGSAVADNDRRSGSHQQQTPPRRPTRMDSAAGGGGSFKGTVNPYTMNMELEPTFVLKPLKRAGERHEPEEREYEGDSVVLNRANTEENNPSITSREQAVIARHDGHWTIEDRSEQRTTFVQAAHRHELHDGDIILLGNRLFEFHE